LKSPFEFFFLFWYDDHARMTSHVRTSDVITIWSYQINSNLKERKNYGMLLVFETSKIMLVNPTMMNILKSVCMNSEEMKYTSTVRSRRVGSCSFFLRTADLIAISKDNNWSLCRQCKSFQIHSKWETVVFFLLQTHRHTHNSHIPPR
jgi:hypothetical protein